MDHNSVKRTMISFVASAFLAATVSPSYAACWGACGGSGSSGSYALSRHYSQTTAQPRYDSSNNYEGRWGFEIHKSSPFMPRHKEEILDYGSAWGAEWGAELANRGYAVSHHNPNDRTD
jgi:hypothetical protein